MERGHLLGELILRTFAGSEVAQHAELQGLRAVGQRRCRRRLAWWNSHRGRLSESRRAFQEPRIVDVGRPWDSTGIHPAELPEQIHDVRR